VQKWAKLLLVAAVVLGATGIVALFDTNLALGMLYGFVRSEVAMLHWMGVMHLSQFWTVIMAILFSSGSIILQFASGSEGGRLLRKFLQPLIVPLRKIFGIQVRIVPKNGDGNGYARYRKPVRKFYYSWLPLFLLEPFAGVLSAVIFSASMGLNIRIACCVILITNVVEKILWSYLVKWLLPYIHLFLAPIMYISLGIVISVAFFRFLCAEEIDNETPPA
jgi:hypothetical protein